MDRPILRKSSKCVCIYVCRKRFKATNFFFCLGSRGPGGHRYLFFPLKIGPPWPTRAGFLKFSGGCGGGGGGGGGEGREGGRRGSNYMSNVEYYQPHLCKHTLTEVSNTVTKPH